MGQATLTNTQQGDIDRSIEVTVTPTLNYPASGQYGATVEYTQTGQDPDTGNMKNRVKKNGDLKLTNLQDADGYTDNVDITFTLDSSKMVDEHGNAVTGRWATKTEYSGTGPVTGFLWFCTVTDAEKREYDTAPIDVPGMTAVRLSDQQVQIDDNTDDSAPDYGYCLGLVLSSKNGYYITLDPMLGSKGTSGVNEFMLKA
ncbi:hypothetical protein [Qipengyuania zhejiangensis]|uniref:hypothetical protein n=1 Tax=Qipengyuania zhejiangensis TaxID=3077782 RepID=UPI002D77938C|nr:hypothetical protein [Qipengyuania sp. Z2]